MSKRRLIDDETPEPAEPPSHHRPQPRELSPEDRAEIDERIARMIEATNAADDAERARYRAEREARASKPALPIPPARPTTREEREARAERNDRQIAAAHRLGSEADDWLYLIDQDEDGGPTRTTSPLTAGLRRRAARYVD